MRNAFNLAGKVALVTGGSQGIGFAIGRSLAEAGASLMIAARRPEPLEDALSRLRRLGGRAEGAVCDVRNGAQTKELAARTEAAFGVIDLLVNNVGASYGDDFRRGPLLEMTEADMDGAMRQNVIGMLNCCWAIVPNMISRGSGVVVNVASVVVNQPMVGFGIYSATKAAVVSLTKTMAIEWAPSVRANALLVGHIDTPRSSSVRTPEETSWLEHHIAMRRLGRPEDVSGAVVYLASDAAAWVTGAAIEVDGGSRSI